MPRRVSTPRRMVGGVGGDAGGAAALALKSDEGVAKLRENVTSPGGTTEEALRSLQAHHFDDVVKEAVKQCAARATTLGKEFG